MEEQEICYAVWWLYCFYIFITDEGISLVSLGLHQLASVDAESKKNKIIYTFMECTSQGLKVNRG